MFAKLLEFRRTLSKNKYSPVYAHSLVSNDLSYLLNLLDTHR